MNKTSIVLVLVVISLLSVMPSSGNISPGVTDCVGGDCPPPTSTATTTPPSSSGNGGGSSGSSGVTTAEPASNIEEYERRDATLYADNPVVYSFTTSIFAIHQVVIVGKENEYDIAVRVEHLKDTSKIVKAPAEGIIYANENVWVGSKRIKEGLIRFKVENSWITDNNLQRTDIQMFRYTDEWKPLETKVIDKDDTYTYFESKTPGFSAFAISGLKEGQLPVESSDTEVVSPETTDKSAESESTETEDTPGFGIVAVIGTISAIYIFGRKRR